MEDVVVINLYGPPHAADQTDLGGTHIDGGEEEWVETLPDLDYLLVVNYCDPAIRSGEESAAMNGCLSDLKGGTAG
ncbi:hypothetical protein ACLOJK_019144 [Asimina triloba]